MKALEKAVVRELSESTGVTMTWNLHWGSLPRCFAIAAIIKLPSSHNNNPYRYHHV